MQLIATVILVAMIFSGCGSTSSRREASPPSGGGDGLREAVEMNESRKVCGWSDSGRWECGTSRSPIKNQKASSPSAAPAASSNVGSPQKPSGAADRGVPASKGPSDNSDQPDLNPIDDP